MTTTRFTLFSARLGSAAATKSKIADLPFLGADVTQ